MLSGWKTIAFSDSATAKYLVILVINSKAFSMDYRSRNWIRCQVGCCGMGMWPRVDGMGDTGHRREVRGLTMEWSIEHPALRRAPSTKENTSMYLLRKWVNPELTLVVPVQSSVCLGVAHLSRGMKIQMVIIVGDSRKLLLCLICNWPYSKNVTGNHSFHCHLNLMRQVLLLFPFHRWGERHRKVKSLRPPAPRAHILILFYQISRIKQKRYQSYFIVSNKLPYANYVLGEKKAYFFNTLCR